MINYIFGYNRCYGREISSSKAILRPPDGVIYDWGKTAKIEDRNNISYLILKELTNEETAKKYYAQYSEEKVAKFKIERFSVTSEDIQIWLRGVKC